MKTDVQDVEQVTAVVKRVVEWTRETGAELGGVVNSAGLGQNQLMRACLSTPHLSFMRDNGGSIVLTLPGRSDDR